MCMIEGGCRADFLKSVHRTARKGHRCSECHRVICMDEKYRYSSGFFDGHFFEAKVCDRCQIAMRWLSENCGGYVFEMMIEDLEEHADEYPQLAPEIMAIVTNARRQWRADDGHLLPIPEMPRSIESLMKEEAAHAG